MGSEGSRGRSEWRKRALEAVRQARRVVPEYGRGPPVTGDEVERLAAWAGLLVHRAVMEMDAPAVLLPPVAGRRRLVLAPGLGPDVTRYVILHEIGHVLTGDAEEITLLRFAGPLPPAEDVADAFALLGVLDEADLAQDPEWVEARIRERVPLDDRGWRRHRVPRMARKVCRLAGDVEVKPTR